ncbi:ester hydrolase C11orf54 homolog isoform X3 [Rhinatrema bivittatum]|uniref:ester hydrolase C11orf54 homolog isoform X3 n=1 Tax=Rhinatrema bivittatum TaxID=194408 RepID=UPI00112C563C|nr:ester hydrolase C11orf54 homolog isoform X3 [Rhinatrema bivittatum]
MGETESFACHVPDLPELAEVLQIGLKKNYADVQVSVVECPDLTQEPFRFPVKGICGKARIADVGGVPYLVPLARLDKIYNINAVAKEIELPGAFILGAGAVSHRTLGENAELILSVQAAYGDKAAVNGSYVARISPAGGGCVLEKYSDRYTDCDFGLLSNLYASRGEPGKPPEFSTCPLNTDEDVNLWLKFFEMRAPLICQSVFVSRDPGFDLRLEHTHCFSHHGEGGHYHTDTTPETVRYLGYFHPAELLYRIDRPKETHTVGRD